MLFCLGLFLIFYFANIEPGLFGSYSLGTTVCLHISSSKGAGSLRRRMYWNIFHQIQAHTGGIQFLHTSLDIVLTVLSNLPRLWLAGSVVRWRPACTCPICTRPWASGTRPRFLTAIFLHGFLSSRKSASPQST